MLLQEQQGKSELGSQTAFLLCLPFILLRSNCSIISQPKQREASTNSSVCAAQPRAAWPWEAAEVKYQCSVKANMSLDPECQLDAKEMWLQWPWSRSWLSPMQMWCSPWELQPESTANLQSIMGSSHRIELKPCPTVVKKKVNYQEKLPCSSYDCRDELVDRKAIQQEKKKKAHGDLSSFCFSIERVSACSRKSLTQLKMKK